MAHSPNEQNSVTWEDILRIIQSAPCNDLQLQRLGNAAQVDSETKMLELSQRLTLTGECWSKKFHCNSDVMLPNVFFQQVDDALKKKSSSGDETGENARADVVEDGKNSAINSAVGDEALKDSAAKIALKHYDLIHWTLDVPISPRDLVGASQRLRAALNINGCLIITLPVRIGCRGAQIAQDFYANLTDAPLMQPQEIAIGLEEGGFEPLAVEFTPNRQVLARYRMIEAALQRTATAIPLPVKNRWIGETKLFLKEGGISFFPSGIFLARRWEYVDGS